jgi:hypothetical protein
VRSRILGCFLENHEFSLGRCHALGSVAVTANLFIGSRVSGRNYLI